QSICATACGSSSTMVIGHDIEENPTCDTYIDPILFPITSSTALRVGHVVPERSTVTVTVAGVSSPPIQPIPTEITVTGNPPLPGHPVNQCLHGEHFSSCSIGFSRGTIQLPAFTITDGTPANTLAVPLLQFEIGPDPSSTTPGWNGFWTGGGDLDVD